MAPAKRYQKVEFKTIDGLKLRGWLYAVDGRAPVIIMTPGFNCVKEMLLPEVAEGFQSLGYNVVIYDPRSIGDSDGSPRNQIDPNQQAEDLSDILTHVSALPNVDPNRIALWGMSFGATVSACTAALDKRAKSLIMVCPIFKFYKPDRWTKVTAQLMKDRHSQLRGNSPFTLPPFNSKGENPIGMAGAGGPGGLEAYTFMGNLDDHTPPNYVNRITLQSYYKMAVWKPKEMLSLVAPMPVMMVVPELDKMSPPEEQIDAFQEFTQPKKLYLAKGKGHLTVLSGNEFQDVLEMQAAFVKDCFLGTLKG
ncbi:DltD domain-containing protein [Patellaria atrata CBS 101060]|uniref:DltD domain-containing protein n=1 Tax=Patellaria atrata CBS 101060 TaxID=1346257 RepID=A0A9P4VWT6_9PEZI|nr:DltD domain-containing protein [Patellaria atrata CBS 101060]